jgi:hypothetical protein
MIAHGLKENHPSQRTYDMAEDSKDNCKKDPVIVGNPERMYDLALF